MTREETIKLLALIKVAYPSAYRDMDKENKLATVAMWHASFSCVPYAVMELAFERYRGRNRFAPSVAEMADEVKDIHYMALFEANAGRGIGDEDMRRRAAALFDMTEAFMRDSRTLGGHAQDGQMLAETNT